MILTGSAEPQPLRPLDEGRSARNSALNGCPMFQQPNRIDTLNTIAHKAIDALDALPADALRGAERDRNFCERLVVEGDVFGVEFREAGAEILRHLARIEPEERFARDLDRAMRRLREAINASYSMAVAFGAECTTSIQRAA
ncbi:MAG: hypothetical protein H5U24_19535 [Thioclava marina]|uniref:hypothetical protein n=1 Tax=Thioclava marina TaxID=1915077 RepID=UPI001988D35E|nr:hypothetical protein [Thioclava marina]MBC7147561.1 hypothetical protein [Thioclava marina]